MRHFHNIAQANVLVVEDDFLIRANAVDIIEEAGFRVDGAGSADDAIRILEQRRNVGVVFTDVHMPGSLNGLDLARLVEQKWPGTGVIVTSGRAMKMDIPGRAIFLAKPYSSWELVEKVLALLEETAGVH
jgi:two-component system, response regulator PdtaR